MLWLLFCIQAFMVYRGLNGPISDTGRLESVRRGSEAICDQRPSAFTVAKRFGK